MYKPVYFAFIVFFYFWHFGIRPVSSLIVIVNVFMKMLKLIVCVSNKKFKVEYTRMQ